MNKHLHRIVFNKLRGILMAVAESARRQGKAGESGGAASGAAGRAFTVSPVAFGVLLATGGVLWAGALQAQIVADRGAAPGLQATILNAANGVPQVNIQTPSAAGVSRNVFSQFDVGRGGAILNNARGNAQTQLGGWVQGNPWLAGGTARVILNEVSSGSPSQLLGYVEVAGDRAQVVIANPAGIACDGCGFINASRSTLTTGTPILNGGSLEGFRVEQGSISVEGAGFDDSRSDYTRLIARSVRINAAVWARDLQVSVGAARVDADGSGASPGAGAGSAPAYALDVSQLGGMYAGKIVLVGTEAGLGVRNAGQIGASAGDLVVTVDGRLENSGSLAASAGVTVAASGGIANSGRFHAQGDTRLATPLDISNSGSLTARGNTTLAAGSVDSLSGSVLAAGVGDDGSIGAGGSLQASASGAIAARGLNLSGTDIRFDGATVSLAGSQTGTPALHLGASRGDVDLSGATLGIGGTLSVATPATLRTDSARISAERLELGARSLSNVGGDLLQTGAADLSILLVGDLGNARGRIASNSRNLQLTAATLGNEDGRIEHGGDGILSVDVSSLAGTRGMILGNGKLDLRASTATLDAGTTSAGQIRIDSPILSNRGGQIIQTGGETLEILASERLDNSAGTVAGSGGVRIAAGNLANPAGLIQGLTGVTLAASGAVDNRGGGRIFANTTVRVDAGSADNTDGHVEAGETLTLRSAGTIDNTRGSLASGGTLNLEAGRLGNTGGDIQSAGGALTLAVAGAFQNSQGRLFSAADLHISVADLANSGTLYSQGRLDIQTSGALSNSAILAARGSFSLEAGSVIGTAGSLFGAGIQADGSLAAAGDLDISTRGSLLAAGQNLAAGRLVMAATGIDLGGSQSQGASIALTAGQGDIVTAGALVATPGELAVSGRSLDNSRGRIEAGYLALQLGGLANRAGQLYQTGAADTRLALTGPGGTLDNSGGLIASNGLNFSLAAPNLINAGGSIAHAGSGTLTVDAVSLAGTGGSLQGNGALRLNAASATLDGAETTAAQLHIGATSLSNRGGQILATGLAPASVRAEGLLDNGDGVIAANGDLRIGAGALLNRGGVLQTTGSSALDVTVSGPLDNSAAGLIAAGGRLGVEAATLDNRRGALQSARSDLALQVSARLDNREGSVFAGRDLHAGLGSLDNTGSLYALGQASFVVGDVLANGATIAAAGNLAISAGQVAGTSASLFGAGIGPDGSLGAAGALRMGSTGSLVAQGQNLAAGGIVLAGSSIDLSGSRSQGGAVDIAASAGPVESRGALLVAAGTLKISAAGGGLDNREGALIAGSGVEVQGASLDNGHGRIESLAGPASVDVRGDLHNQDGRIVSGTDLRISAAGLANAGTVYGQGRLDLAVGDMDNRGMLAAGGDATLSVRQLTSSGFLGAGIQADGSLAARGDLRIMAAGSLGASGQNLAAGVLDFRASRMGLAASETRGASIALTAGGDIDTRGALLATPGDLLITAADVDNRQGLLEGGHLDLHAASLANARGQINQTGTGVAGITLGGALDNRAGLVAGNGGLSLSAASVDNAAGSIQVAGPASVLVAGDLQNQQGRLTAGGELRVAVTDLANTGTVYGATQLDIRAAGSLANAAIVASGGNLSIDAGSVLGSGGSLFGAGILADGSLAGRGDLEVLARGSVKAAGQNIAAGRLGITAAAIDLGASHSQGAGIALAATGGDILTQGAVLRTPGELVASASGLDNGQGRIEAGHLDLHLERLDNRGGELIQTGSADTRLALASASATLDNRGGLIAVNGANLGLSAATLLNQDGRLLHAGSGSFRIDATSIGGAGGLIQGNGSLQIKALGITLDGADTAARRVNIDAATLSNRGGRIAHTGAEGMDIHASGLLDNTAGSVAGNGDVHIGAGSLMNRDGTLQGSGTATLGLTVAGPVDNTGGLIVAGGRLTVEAAALDNRRGVLQSAGTDVDLRLAGRLDNTDGSVFAGGALRATLGSLDNGGSLYALGSASFSVRERLANTGVLAARGDTTVVAGQLAGSAASLFAAGMGPDGSFAPSGDLTISSTGSLAALGRNLAAGTARLSGAGVDLAGSRTEGVALAISASGDGVTTRGAHLFASGSLTLTGLKALDNRDGTLSAGQIDLQGASLDNRGGEIVQAGTGDTRLAFAGLFDNQGGRVASNGGRLGLSAAAVDNTDGHIEHAGNGTLAIDAGSFAGARGVVHGNGALVLGGNDIALDGAETIAARVRIDSARLSNRGGQIVQGGTGTLEILASSTFDNTAGTVTSRGDARLAVGSLGNREGLLQAAGSLSLDAIAAVDNRDGILLADRQLALQAGSADNTRGRIEAQGGAATVGVAGSLDNSVGRIASGGDMRLAAATLANSGTLYSLGSLNLSAGTVNNAAVIAARGNLKLDAGQVAGNATSLFAAGIQADGSLAAAGDLDIRASGALVSGGRNLAAGALALAGESIDLGGSRIQGAGVVLDAAGALVTASAVLTTSGTLAISARDMDNRGGRIEAGLLEVNAASLANGAGQIVQTGSGAARIALTAGLDNQAGSIAGNGGLEIAAATIDNRGGVLQSLGRGSLVVGAGVDNRGGLLAVGGALNLAASALDNTGGTVSAGEGASLGFAGAVTNLDGLMVSKGGFGLEAGSLDNSRGVLQSSQGGLKLSLAGALVNGAGRVLAGQDLRAALGSLDNTGHLYAGGDAGFTVASSVSNTAFIAAGGSLSIDAGTLSGAAGSVFGAGIRGDGSLGEGGDLGLSAGGELRAGGQNVAAGRLGISAAAIDLGASQTQGGSIALTATGDILAAGAVLRSAGAFAATARSLDNSQGRIEAGRLDVQVGGLDNRGGELIQTGGSDARVAITSATGSLDNRGGLIAVNGVNFSLSAPSLLNAGGRLLHAGSGTFGIDGASLSGAGGLIQGNGSLRLDAGSVVLDGADTIASRVQIGAADLSNRGGRIVHTGIEGMEIRAAGLFDNSGGSVAGNGDLHIAAGALQNSAGSLRSGGGAGLEVSVAGLLDNQAAGAILAGGSARIAAGALANGGGQLGAGQDLTVDVVGTLDNAGGTISARQGLAARAGRVDNRGGQIASVEGGVGVTAGEVLDNTRGRIEAAGLLALSAPGLANREGVVAGGAVQVRSGGFFVDNASGLIAARRDLDISSGRLDNTGGTLQAGGVLGVDTGGQALLNVRSGSAGGILGQGGIVLRAGNVDNSAGFIGGRGPVTLKAAQITNGLGGVLSGEGALAVVASSFDNRGGQVVFLGDVGVDVGAGLIDNRGSLIRSGATATLIAGTVDNRDTQGSGQGIEGRSVLIRAGQLANVAGALRADERLDIVGAGVQDNTRGLIASGQTLSLRDGRAEGKTQAVINAGGTLLAGQSLLVDSASLGGDGKLLSHGELALRIAGDYTHTGQFQADGNASLVTTGTFINRATLVAGGTLSVDGAGIDNTATGEMTGGATRVATAGTLTNRGLINGGDVRIDAATLANLGSGRIYGTRLAVQAGTLLNGEEGDRAATVAARERLDLGVQSLTNREHALIFSAGDLAVGAVLDGSAHASGQADVLINSSATLEALGNMSLASGLIRNTNAHFSSDFVQVSQEHVIEFMPRGTSLHFAYPDEVTKAWDRNTLVIVVPGFCGPSASVHCGSQDFSLYEFTRTVSESRVLSSDPGQILAGGSLQLNAGTMDNDRSRVLAGGAIVGSLGALNNIDEFGLRVVHDEGWGSYHQQSGDSDEWFDKVGYAPPDTVYTVPLRMAQVQEHFSPAGSGMQLASLMTSRLADVLPTLQMPMAALHVGALVESRGSVVDPEAASAASVGLAGTGGGLVGVAAAGSGSPAGPVFTKPVVSAGEGGGVDGRLLAANSATPAMGSAGGVAGVGGAGRSGRLIEVRAAASEAVLADKVVGQATAGLAASGIAGTAPGAAGGASSAAAEGAGVPEPGRAALPVPVAATKRPAIPTATGSAAVSAMAVDPVAAGNAAASAAAAPGAAPGQPGVAGTIIAPAPMLIRSVVPDATLPAASLFHINPGAPAGYLVETDARFTNGREWLGSDYLLKALALDPSTLDKRLGDGFYEQRLVREQVAMLTGRRFLDGYASDEAEYRALLDSAATVAREWGLVPGVALSAEQMARLTSDIVWLVDRPVTLPDGRVVQALVPQVYVHVREGDLDGSGALISGNSVDLGLAGDLSNQGSIAGRSVVSLAAENLSNLGGRISGRDVSAVARQDLVNRGGVIQGDESLTVLAGQDLTVATTTRSEAGNGVERSHIDRVAGLYVTGSTGAGRMVVGAGQDLTLAAAQITNLARGGSTLIAADRDLKLDTVSESTRHAFAWDDANYSRGFRSTDVGTTLQASGDIRLQAGQDISLRAATVASSAGDLAILAGRDLAITAGQKTFSLDEAHRSTSSGTFSKHTTTTRDITDRQTLVATTLAGQNIDLAARTDLRIEAGLVTAQKALRVEAGRDVQLLSAESVLSESHLRESGRTQGLGKKTVIDTADRLSVVQHGTELRAGSIDLSAGQDLTMVAANLAAKGDIHFQAGGKVEALAAANVEESRQGTSTRNNLLGFENLSGVLDNGWQKGKQDIANSGTSRSAAVTAIQSEGGVFIQSGGDTRLQASRIEAQSLAVAVGRVDGKLVNPEAKLVFEGLKESTASSHTDSGGSFMWQNQVGAGKSEESLKLPEIHLKPLATAGLGGASGGVEEVKPRLQFETAGGVVVGAMALPLTQGEKTRQESSPATGGQSEVSPAQVLDLKTQAQSLAQQPGLGYLGDLAKRTDVDWQPVALAKEKWDYAHHGLTQEGAAVAAIAVTIATWGMASEAGAALATDAGMTTAAGSAGASATAAAGAGVAGSGVAAGTVLTTTGSIVASAAAAGMTTLVSTAAVSLANNNGDIGKTLQELGSSQNVKVLIASMIGGGLAPAATSALGLAAPTAGTVFVDRLAYYTTQAAVRAGVQSVVYGQPLSETAKNGLVEALAQSLTAEIGDLGRTQGIEAGSAAKIVAHAIVQCAAASLTKEDCGSGALGGAAAEALSPLADASGQWGKLVAPVGAMLAAKLTGEDVNTALRSAQMVDTYNRQLHPAQIAKIQRLSNGDPAREQQLTQVLCVLQNCDLDGVNGRIDSPARELKLAGEALFRGDAVLYLQLKREVLAAGLLSDAFDYGAADRLKDRLGLGAQVIHASASEYIQRNQQGLVILPDSPVDNVGVEQGRLTEVLKGAAKGVLSGVKDAPNYPSDNEDQARGRVAVEAGVIVAGIAVPGVVGKGVGIVEEVFTTNEGRILSYRPTSGVLLKSKEGITTTILGSYDNDMLSIARELGNVKSNDFGPRVGGFNVLNVADSLYVSPQQFWAEYNQPWLSNAIQRGDSILMATHPAFDVTNVTTGFSVLSRPNLITGKFELSIFGREYLMMRRTGYRYQNGVMGK